MDGCKDSGGLPTAFAACMLSLLFFESHSMLFMHRERFVFNLFASEMSAKERV
jgi:hypothetical protein